MESMVERGFARLLRTRMQPVEVAKRLSREMEAHRTVAVNHVLVPNRYVATLSAKDYEQFSSIQATLQKEIARYLLEYAAERSYTIPGSPTVQFERDDRLHAGSFRVKSRMEDPDDDAEGTEPLHTTQIMPEPNPPPQARAQPSLSGRTRLDLPGASCYIDIDTASIGRGLDNDVVVEDPRVSRHHARLQRGTHGWEISDLGSTNGTFVNGKRVARTALGTGDVVSLGGLELKFFLETPRR
jgi:hypothetical protein